MDSLQQLKGLSEIMYQFCDRITNFLDRSIIGDDLTDMYTELNKLRRECNIVSGKMLSDLTDSLARPNNVGNLKSRTTTVDSEAKTNLSQVNSFNLLRKSFKNELRCAICSELMVSAITLNCKHSFCYVCIFKWRNRTKSCPVCRTSIISLVRSQALDNLIATLKLFPKMNKNSELIEPIQQPVVEAGPAAETDSRPQALVGFRTPTTPRPPIVPFGPLPAINRRPTAVQQQHRRPIRSALPVTARRRNPPSSSAPVVQQQQQRQPAQPIRRPLWRH